MNDAIFKFKRYEDTSLSYTGIDKHAGEAVGGWDTVIKREEYDRLFANQQETMTSGLRTSNANNVIVSVPVKEKKAIASTPHQKSESIKQPPVYKRAEEKEEVKEVTYSFNVGTKVNHKSFGKGEITWISENKKYFYVKFEVAGSKTFTNPKAFEDKFLEIL